MQTAELVIFSDAIFDSINDEPFSGGIAISGEKIEYIGSRASVTDYIGPYTVIRDFGNRLVFPGLCDSHIHLDGLLKKECAAVAKDLGKYRSEEECARAVRDYADKFPDLRRINGHGWILTNWGPNAKPPTKASLDKYFPDIPVYLFGADGHTNWINSRAIMECDLAGRLRDNPQYPEESAPKDENGEFTGFIKELLALDVYNFALSVPPEEWAKFFTTYVKVLNSMGLTAVSDVTLLTHDSFIQHYWPLKAMEDRGILTARCYLSIMPRGEPPYSAEQIDELGAYREIFSSDRLRVAGIKTGIDGIPFTYTATLLEPYSDNPSETGVYTYPPEVPKVWYKEANRLGYSVRVHCCGDAAVRIALDSFEESNKTNDNSHIRNSVEHLDCVSDTDIPRFAELGVVASMQPAHLIMVNGILAERYGDRIKNEWCFRKLLNANATIAIGTDSPVVDVNPYLTIYKAVTRKDVDGTQYGPMTLDQALTLPEVLKGYTVNGAYVNSMEHKVGTLEAGKYADIAVADRNLFDVPPDELKDCRTICTIFSGKIVYEE